MNGTGGRRAWIRTGPGRGGGGAGGGAGRRRRRRAGAAQCARRRSRLPASPRVASPRFSRARPGMAAPPRRRSASPAPLPPVPPALLVLAVLLGGGPGAAAVAAAAASREPPGPCRVKTVTVSTLPVLRENDISWSGAPPPAAADSRLLLFVRSELPGRVAVQDDLDNTELPFFTLGKRRPLPARLCPQRPQPATAPGVASRLSALSLFLQKYRCYFLWGGISAGPERCPCSPCESALPAQLRAQPRGRHRGAGISSRQPAFLNASSRCSSARSCFVPNSLDRFCCGTSADFLPVSAFVGRGIALQIAVWPCLGVGARGRGAPASFGPFQPFVCRKQRRSARASCSEFCVECWLCAVPERRRLLLISLATGFLAFWCLYIR